MSVQSIISLKERDLIAQKNICLSSINDVHLGFKTLSKETSKSLSYFYFEKVT